MRARCGGEGGGAGAGGSKETQAGAKGPVVQGCGRRTVDGAGMVRGCAGFPS
jgi:hypothetical protein